jgi:hypothetical protein
MARAMPKARGEGHLEVVCFQRADNMRRRNRWKRLLKLADLSRKWWFSTIVQPVRVDSEAGSSAAGRRFEMAKSLDESISLL